MEQLRQRDEVAQGRSVHRPAQGRRRPTERQLYTGIVESSARVSATTRAVNVGSRASSEPIIG